MASTGVPGSGVRPTKTCLSDDLGLPLPDIATILDFLDHELLQKAQRLPNEVEAGGSERVAALDDRVWLKVKTDSWRGAGAAGHRRGDSAAKALTSNVSTTHLLPTEWDRDRLSAELALQAHYATRRLIPRMAAQSMRTMKVVGFDFHDHEVRVFIRATHGEAYIAIAAAGIADPGAFAMLLRAIPGIQADDWMPEPNGHPQLCLTPRPGEILWSAVIPPEAAGRLLDDSEGTP
jgi:hypothetical protein